MELERMVSRDSSSGTTAICDSKFMSKSYLLIIHLAFLLMVGYGKVNEGHGRKPSVVVRALEVQLWSVPYGLVVYRRGVTPRALTAAELLVWASKDVGKEITGTTPPPSFGFASNITCF